MNINDIMLQGDADPERRKHPSKYYNVGKNNAATADAGYLGIRGKAVQTDFMMPQLQGLRESGSRIIRVDRQRKSQRIVCKMIMLPVAILRL